MPSAPAHGATPTNAASPSVTAPIEAGTVPSAVIPTITPTAKEELGLLNIRRDGQWREPINGHCAGLAGGANETDQHRGDVNRRSHDFTSLVATLGKTDNRGWICLFPTNRGTDLPSRRYCRRTGQRWWKKFAPSGEKGERTRAALQRTAISAPERGRINPRRCRMRVSSAA